MAQFSIQRGLIRAADGTILASNRIKKVGGQKLYLRRYPQGGLFAHLVGYSTQSRSRAGLESSLNDYLTGSNSNLGTVLKTTLDKIRGATIKGNDVWLTVKPGAQRVAMQQLEGKCGSVVALDPRTGKVLVMASRPTYNPNLVESDFARINNIRAACRPAAPLLNRATDGLYTPGSTFKVVTSAAALDSGKYTIDSRFVDKGYCIEYGKQVQNFGDQSGPEVLRLGRLPAGARALDQRRLLRDRQGDRRGPHPRHLEAVRLLRGPAARDARQRALAERPLQPRQALLPERPGDAGRPGPARVRPGADARDAGADGDGRGGGRATEGVIMEPHAVDRIVSPTGGIVTRTKPRKYKRAMTTHTADDLDADDGGGRDRRHRHGRADPGRPRRRQDGNRRGRRRRPGSANTTWFIAFAPVGAPRVAIAVVLQDQTGSGGTTAAPIAKAVMQAILAGKSNP